ncbi:multicopper oxidase [Xylariaceae sp. FL0804]|nr:multicopper oxidase [Xylariaceae sp. FL0804]
MSPWRGLFTLSFLSSLVLGSPYSLTSSNLAPRAACSGNTASTRSEWCDYSIETDYYEEAPDTGVTREYWFELTEVTVAPDGVSRYAQAINGSIPGPTIIADWGDTVTVHYTNSLSESLNGTSLHFHGIRQNWTNPMDGVTSITQCPTASGNSVTYTWKATQYGSSWYHSHYSLQAWEGVAGGIIINGPATANYDEDLGTIMLSDWTHQTVDELWEQAETDGTVTLDDGLINGTGVYNGGGSRFEVSFEEGTSYRMRLINGAVDTHFKFSIDNHTMTVIASDFVPIEPFDTTILNIGMGQRYDVIVTADQSSVADNFWMRAIAQAACSENNNPDDIRGIVTYASTASTPTTTGWNYTDSCDDETDNLTPYLSKTVGDDEYEVTIDVALGSVGDYFRWTMNNETFQVDYENPTLLQIINNSTNFTAQEGVHLTPEADVWVYLVIESELTPPHPIHLHGHDFFVLAQGTGTYSSSTSLNLNNPARRDVAMLPGSGYLVLAWKTDNPGVWLMHCHIGWHTSEGLALQWVERADEILGQPGIENVTDSCATWSSHSFALAVENDSGI